MVYGRKVCAQRHVIEIRIRLRRTERRVNQFFILPRQRNIPCGEFLLQRAELTARQCMAKSSRTAVGQKSNTTVTQTKYVSGFACVFVVENAHDLALTEMISTAEGTQLTNLFHKVGKLILAQPVESQRKGVTRFIVTHVSCIFASLRPVERDTKSVQHFRRCA